MGVGLVRSLQPPDILLIHWRVYNSTANTSKGVLFLPPSDAYVRSFLYLLYTLIKLYYTKALSNQASSLALDWILLLWRPRIPASSTAQQQPLTCYRQVTETSSSKSNNSKNGKIYEQRFLDVEQKVVQDRYLWEKEKRQGEQYECHGFLLVENFWTMTQGWNPK